MTKTMLLCGLLGAGLALGGCNSKPETNIDKIDNLKKQVQADAKTLNDIEAKEFVTLQKDFMTCDSLLQYQSPEQVDKSFEKLQLVQAYIEQFKFTKPLMQADMDTTLLQLDRLKADAESHYIADSLVAVYIEKEAEYVDKLGNQVRYFQDRFSSCQQDLNALKKQK
jgi:hypothetical protein